LFLLAVVFASAAGPFEADAADDRVVALVPLGPVDRSVLDAIGRAIETRLQAKVRVDPARPVPEAAFRRERGRYRAEKILDALDRDPPEAAFKVLAVTEAEISTTKGRVEDFRVGGLGNVAGTSSVVSLWIFRQHSPSRPVFVRRAVDLSVHELGHTLGLPHCESPRCVMRDAKGKILSSVDTSSGQYCERCRARLPVGLLR
jgi:archaemetzincin